MIHKTRLNATQNSFENSKMSNILRSFLVFLPMISGQNIPLWQDIDYNFQPLPLEGATYIARRDFAGFEPGHMGFTSYKRGSPFDDIEDFMVKRSGLSAGQQYKELVQ